jgi:hypothetical protein
MNMKSNFISIILILLHILNNSICGPTFSPNHVSKNCLRPLSKKNYDDAIGFELNKPEEVPKEDPVKLPEPVRKPIPRPIPAPKRAPAPSPVPMPEPIPTKEPVRIPVKTSSAGQNYKYSDGIRIESMSLVAIDSAL